MRGRSCLSASVLGHTWRPVPIRCGSPKNTGLRADVVNQEIWIGLLYYADNLANVNALQRVYPNGMISSWTTVDWFELNSYVVTLTLYPEHLMTCR